MLRKKLNREQLATFAGTVTGCVIAMESCPGSRYWGRVFARADHDVRILPAQFVKPCLASALYRHGGLAAVGDGRTFAGGRNMAAWLGLAPRQYTTGGKPSLGGISKRGNTYLCQLFIQGALDSF